MGDKTHTFGAQVYAGAAGLAVKNFTLSDGTAGDVDRFSFILGAMVTFSILDLIHANFAWDAPSHSFPFIRQHPEISKSSNIQMIFGVDVLKLF